MYKLLFLIILFLLLIFNSYSQHNKTIDLEGESKIEIKILNDSLKVHSDSLDKNLILNLTLQNKSDSNYNFIYRKNTVFNYPFVNKNNEICLFSGFSVGLYNKNDSTQVIFKHIQYQPLPPEEAWNDDDKLITYYKDKVDSLNILLKNEPINRDVVFNLKSYETKKIELPILFEKNSGNANMYYNLEKDEDYLLKLFYCEEDVSHKLEKNKINCVISNTVMLFVQ